MGHEVIVVEQRRMRYDLLLPELEERLLFGDGTEIWVLEKAGIARADMVVAVTGDDEDNIIISQLAKLKYDVPKVVARVNNPRNQPTFDLLGVDATVCAATMLDLDDPARAARRTSSCRCSRSSGRTWSSSSSR